MKFKTVPEIIEIYGFRSLGGCFCNNNHVRKFKTDQGLKLEWRPKNNTFKLYDRSKFYTTTWEKVIHLEIKLQNIVEVV